MTGRSFILGRLPVPGREFGRERRGRRKVLAVLASAAAVCVAAALAVPGPADAGAVFADRGLVLVAGPAALSTAVSGPQDSSAGVPGLERRALGGVSAGAVFSVSCASAGNCTAGSQGGFVAGERNGVWGQAAAVPGLAGLGGGAVYSVSCASAGNCAAGGYYHDDLGDPQGFVAAERNGVWGQAIAVPGLAALNTSGAVLTSLSCGSAGNCAASGYYYPYTMDDPVTRGFVAVERNGTWGRAIEVPGLAAMAAVGYATVTSVSCGPAGNCAAGGWYQSHSGAFEGFMADARNGTWGRAIEVPGLGALNKGRSAGVSSVSCGPRGYCGAGGDYLDGSGHAQGFVVVARNGAWGRAIEVPGLGALSGVYGQSQVSSLSCASPGNCGAGGSYYDRAGHAQGFVVSQRNGTWGRAAGVPGLGALNKGRFAQVSSLSCASPGNCGAGGTYYDRSGHEQGFVVSQRNGTWHRAIELAAPAP